MKVVVNCYNPTIQSNPSTTAPGSCWESVTAVQAHDGMTSWILKTSVFHWCSTFSTEIPTVDLGGGNHPKSLICHHRRQPFSCFFMRCCDFGTSRLRTAAGAEWLGWPSGKLVQDAGEGTMGPGNWIHLYWNWPYILGGHKATTKWVFNYPRLKMYIHWGSGPRIDIHFGAFG